MATPATTPALTISNSADELKQAALAAEQTPPATTPPGSPAPTPAAPPAPAAPADAPYSISKTEAGVEIKLKTGQIYRGVTLDDAAAELAKGQIAASERIAELSKQPPAPEPPPAPAAQPTPEQLAEQQAQELLLNVVAKGLGFNDGNALKAAVGEMTGVTEAQRSQQVAGQFFAACPEFPGGDAAADKLTARVAQMGLDANNPAHLRAAHLLCVAEKDYVPLTQDQIAALVAGGPKPAAPAAATPPPMLPSSQAAASPSAEVINPYDPKVSLEDVRKWAMAAAKK